MGDVMLLGLGPCWMGDVMLVGVGRFGDVTGCSPGLMPGA